jgi:hypothetical protein
VGARRRRVPTRTLGDIVIVARPRDGGPVVLESTAALVWQQLENWTTPDEIDQTLAKVYPDVPDEDRVEARIETLKVLGGEGLIEQS